MYTYIWMCCCVNEGKSGQKSSNIKAVCRQYNTASRDETIVLFLTWNAHEKFFQTWINNRLISGIKIIPVFIERQNICSLFLHENQVQGLFGRANCFVINDGI